MSDLKNLIEEFQQNINEIERRLEVYSDYSCAYGCLLDEIDRVINELNIITACPVKEDQ